MTPWEQIGKPEHFLIPLRAARSDRKDGAATYEAALDCATRALAADPGCSEAYLNRKPPWLH